MNLGGRKAGVAAAILGAAALAGACRGNVEEKRAPTAEMKSETPTTATNQPTTVTGCLRSGDAANTFVLTTTQAEPGGHAATYQLVGVEGVSLQDHVGERVQVDGVVNAQKQMASSTATTRQQEKTTGTSGTPAVSTQATVDVRRIDVSAVRKVEGKCEP